ncbi:MAG: CBS domain-containing protein [Candidatus Rokubacteria bacterium]|nr:CBS domain-containing protein [Candidatus Rokubacteria bacterium]
MIGQVCTKPVVTVSPGATVQEAARLMQRKNVGALVVVGSSRPQGILTDRDIAMAVVAEGRDPATLSVGAVMRKNPAVIREDRGIFDAIKLLSAKGVRRLPVVSRTGKLTGIIALDDLLMLLGTEMGHVSHALSRGLGRPRLALAS